MTKEIKKLKQEYKHVCAIVDISSLMASNNESTVLTETCRVKTARATFESSSAQADAIYAKLQSRNVRIKRQH